MENNEIFIIKDNGAECTREEVESIFLSADQDGSGMLSIKEFKKSNKGRFQKCYRPEGSLSTHNIMTSNHYNT